MARQRRHQVPLDQRTHHGFGRVVGLRAVMYSRFVHGLER
jgi:hypothetical protein